ncbi:hypothetical protein MMC32_004511 [Xylographa parallela]|nr:hypothetical protein [Xylographa parallela]
MFPPEELVPPPKVTGEEMEGIRPADPEVRAKYHAENALLALYRIDLAVMHACAAWPVLYDGRWVPKQLEYTAGHDSIYEPVDLAAYTASGIDRAVTFIQTGRCFHFQHSNQVAQRWNGVSKPSVAPFTPIFKGPVHDVAYLYELVRQGRHPNRRVALHRTLELAEQCIYKLLQSRLDLPDIYGPADPITH